jgi:fimbrial chaperone protein
VTGAQPRSLICAGFALVLGGFVLCQAAFGGDFMVSPTSLQVAADVRSATVTVKVSGPGESLGQVRVMRWLRDDGEGKLVATRDVVASPPALRMKPNQEITIRLVRTAKTPVRGQECYRILIDQLPNRSPNRLSLSFAIRLSVPLCFGT